MPLSSNTLIHFTEEKECIKGILQENFKVFNCRESIVLGGGLASWIIPMVSFCDIPLSEIKDHISKYGDYGVGMTKEWAIRRGLNPVLYIAQQSTLSESYRRAWNCFNVAEGLDAHQWTDGQKALADVLRYIKNYEGELSRKGQTTPDYRFSDEREWRYVPAYSEACDMLLSASWYDFDDNKQISDSKLDSYQLEFEPNDIKYIIIKSDTEIGEFIDHLRRAKGKKYSLHEVERLTTRILTVEQIMSDI